MPRRPRSRRTVNLDKMQDALGLAAARTGCTKLIHPYINSDTPPPVAPGCEECAAVLAWWNSEEASLVREALRAEREADEQRARRRVDSPEPGSFAEPLDDLRKI
jgi:hypothetical protein